MKPIFVVVAATFRSLALIRNFTSNEKNTHTPSGSLDRLRLFAQIDSEKLGRTI